jgi:molecular chaperone GrpE
MKKIPVTESEKAKNLDEAKPRSTLLGKATSDDTRKNSGAAEPISSAENETASDTDRAESDDPMAGLQADLDRFRDLALRSQADFENYKKRSARERDEAIKYANSSLLERLVPIIDNFELGLLAARSEGEQSPIYSGMSLVLKQLNDFLTDNGLQPIEAVGHKFDPNLHEAIAHEPSEEVPEGFVIRQTRRGYRFKNRLLRPSSVVVSSGRQTK